MSALIFCISCGSHLVDVNSWTEDGAARFRCCVCGQEAPVKGFALGRARLEHGTVAERRAFVEARFDVATPEWMPRTPLVSYRDQVEVNGQTRTVVFIGGIEHVAKIRDGRLPRFHSFRAVDFETGEPVTAELTPAQREAWVERLNDYFRLVYAGETPTARLGLARR